jgi:hypothetical protein
MPNSKKTFQFDPMSNPHHSVTQSLSVPHQPASVQYGLTTTRAPDGAPLEHARLDDARRMACFDQRQTEPQTSRHTLIAR